MITIPGLGTIDFGPIGKCDQPMLYCEYQEFVHIALQITTVAAIFTRDECGMYRQEFGWKWRTIQCEGDDNREVTDDKVVAPDWFRTALKRICETQGGNDMMYIYNPRDFPGIIWVYLTIPGGRIEHPIKWLEERIAPMLLPPQ